jgi:hypothetical protein
MPESASNLPLVPVAQAAEPTTRPSVKVGHVPQSLLPPSTVQAGAVPEAREPMPIAAPAPAPVSPPPAEEAFELPSLTSDALVFLTSPHYKESDTSLGQLFNLSEEDLSFLHEMDQMVLGKMIGVDGYIRALRGEFPQWDVATREKFIGRLVAERFMPWGDRLKPSAKAAAAQESLVLPHVPYYALYDAALTYQEAATEIGKMVEIPFSPNMVGRLGDLVKSRSKGVRVAEQAEAQLMRSLDQGGLALQPEQARATVIAMGDLLQRVEVREGEGEVLRRPTPPDSVTKSVAAVPVAVPLSAPILQQETQDDLNEIAAIAKAMPPALNRAEVLAQSVEAVMHVLTGKPEDAYLLRRLENIVSTRLRDVRSRNEVLSTLARGTKVGGLGLGRAEAERLATEIEAGYAEWHERIAAEASLAHEEQERAQALKTDAQKKKEAEEHAAWFAEKARQKQAAMPKIVPKAAPVPVGGHPLDAREQVREEQAFGKLVGVPQKSMGVEDFLASLSATPKPIATPAAPRALPAVPPPVPPKPVAPAVKISEASAKAVDGTAPSRPRMDDVQAVRASGLVGPHQELERLTLGAFRRLGKTPEAAADHVRNLVRLLQEQSFGKRVEGIRAWQGSPLQRQYVGLVAEAFSSGTPMKDLLAKKRTAGEDVPTDEELTILVMLNGDLRL